MSYNLHPYSDCSPYRRNGKGLAYQTSERTGEMSWTELKAHLRHSFSLNGAGLDILMRLYDALGTNGNKEQFKRWCAAYFPVQFTKDTFKLNKTEFKLGDEAWQFEDANATPWFDIETDGEAKQAEFDMAKLLKMLHSVAKKASKNGFDTQARQIDALADILNAEPVHPNEVE